MNFPSSGATFLQTWKRIVGIAKGLSSFLRVQGFQPIGWRDCFTNARSSSVPNNIGDFSLRMHIISNVICNHSRGIFGEGFISGPSHEFADQPPDSGLTLVHPWNVDAYSKENFGK